MSLITFLETWQGGLEGWPQLGLSRDLSIVLSGNQTFYMAVQRSMHYIGKQSLRPARFKERD